MPIDYGLFELFHFRFGHKCFCDPSFALVVFSSSSRCLLLVLGEYWPSFASNTRPLLQVARVVTEQINVAWYTSSLLPLPPLLAVEWKEMVTWPVA